MVEPPQPRNAFATNSPAFVHVALGIGRSFADHNQRQTQPAHCPDQPERILARFDASYEKYKRIGSPLCSKRLRASQRERGEHAIGNNANPRSRNAEEPHQLIGLGT